MTLACTTSDTGTTQKAFWNDSNPDKFVDTAITKPRLKACERSSVSTIVNGTTAKPRWRAVACHGFHRASAANIKSSVRVTASHFQCPRDRPVNPSAVAAVMDCVRAEEGIWAVAAKSRRSWAASTQFLYRRVESLSRHLFTNAVTRSGSSGDTSCSGLGSSRNRLRTTSTVVAPRKQGDPANIS